MNRGYYFLGYIIISYISMIILLILWLKELKEKYSENEFKKLAEDNKILWIIGIAFSPLIIPIAIIKWFYDKIKNLFQK